MRYRGRPVLGGIAGLLLGAFVAVDLALFGVRPLDEIAVYGFPAAGLVVGLVIGLWGPLGRGRAARRAGLGVRSTEPGPDEPSAAASEAESETREPDAEPPRPGGETASPKKTGARKPSAKKPASRKKPSAKKASSRKGPTRKRPS